MILLDSRSVLSGVGLLIVFLAVSPPRAAARDDQDGAVLRDRLEHIAELVRQSHVEVSSQIWVGDPAELDVLQFMEAWHDFPRERYVLRARGRPRNETPAWRRAMEWVQNGDVGALWEWVRSQGKLSIAVSDGQRSLRVGGSPTDGWSERLKARVDPSARPAAMYAWLWGPGDFLMTEAALRATAVRSTSSPDSSGECFLLVASSADRSEQLAEGVVKPPVVCMRFLFEAGAHQLPSRITMTRLGAADAIAELGQRLGDHDVICTPQEGELVELEWELVEAQAVRGGYLPAHVRTSKGSGRQIEDHVLDWRELSPVERDSDIFDPMRRQGVTRNGPFYFHTDELTGLTMKSEGGGPLRPWSVDQYGGGGRLGAEGQDDTSTRHLAIWIGLALLALGALGLLARRWYGRLSE